MAKIIFKKHTTFRLLDLLILPSNVGIIVTVFPKIVDFLNELVKSNILNKKVFIPNSIGVNSVESNFNIYLKKLSIDYDQDELIWKTVAYTSSKYSNVDKITHHTYSGGRYRFVVRRDQIYNRKVEDFNLFRNNHEVAFTYLVRELGTDEIY
ncbi:hypothetical protein [Mycoplasma testudineum]|nr:hypothetical protein [Mycoplasma testudineum]OYD26507.1 hypothetical protein CG473_03635 [Mycoplasma testudineum]